MNKVVDQKQKPMPFIVGVGRSGTTLLRVMLNAHPDLAIQRETKFSFDELYQNRHNEDFREGAKKCIFGSPNWDKFRLSKKDLSKKIDALKPFSVAGALRIFYQLHAEQSGKKRFGEKTPAYCLEMQKIEAILPEAHFIHIIRDGRAVASSRKDLWFGPGNHMEQQAEDWMHRIKQARKQGERVEHYIEVRYEDLILHTEKVLREICEFIKIKFSSEMLLYYTKNSQRKNLMTNSRHVKKEISQAIEKNEKKPNIHKLVTKKTDSSRIDAWKKELSKKEIQEFEDVAGSFLRRLNYKCVSGLVSICMVAHNDEKYIYSAVASILDQTYDNLEIIIIDDCSVDKTVEIIENIEDNRIHIIKNKEHKGVFVSRKIALNSAIGDYVAMMSCDDIALGHRIQIQVEVLSKGYDFCGGWAFVFEEDMCNTRSDVFRALRYNKEVKGTTIKTLENQEDVKANLLFGSSIIDETVMFSRVFLDNVDDFYKQKDGDAADYMSWSELLLKKDVKFKNIQKALVCFRECKMSKCDTDSIAQNEKTNSVREVFWKALEIDDCYGVEVHNHLVHCNYNDVIDVKKVTHFYNDIIAKNKIHKVFDEFILSFYIKSFIKQVNKTLEDNTKIQLKNGSEIVLTQNDYLCDITFIVPFYNVQRFLRQCLDSIQLQNGCKFEVIMIDDGSDDNSASIAKEYLSDVRFKYIYQDNMGVSAARNMGIAQAQGKYTAFVDADDYIIDDFCTRLLGEIGKSEVIVFGQKAFDEYSNRIDIRFNPIKNQFVNDEVFSAYVKRLFGYPVWNKLYRTELLKTIRFGNIVAHEDELFGVELFAQAQSVKVIDYIGYMYRQRQSSLTKMRSRQNIKGLLKIDDMIDSIFQKYSLDTRFSDECAVLKSVFLRSSFKHLNRCLIHERDEDYLQLSLIKKLSIKNDLLQNNIENNKGALEIMQQDVSKLQQQDNQSQKEQKIVNIEQVAKQRKQENEELKRSKSFRLGNLFFRSIKNPYKLLVFPINFINILFEK